MNHSFEMALTQHCAPVLLGKKPAALVPDRGLPSDCPWALLRGQGVSVVRLCWRGKERLTLVYREALLANALADMSARQTLAKLGYPVDGSVRVLLGHLHRRFRQCAAFPHEVGFFLGYPPEDVVGFMRCEAECKLCGAWKVYGDVARAEATFREYKNCRNRLLNHLESGGSIFTVNLTALAG